MDKKIGFGGYNWAHNHVALIRSHGCLPRVIQAGIDGWGILQCSLPQEQREDGPCNFVSCPNLALRVCFTDHHVGPSLSLVQLFILYFSRFVHYQVDFTLIQSSFCFVPILIGRGILNLSNINLGLGTCN